jgi:nuclear transport factor 2 (NTF2) superfamily protein
MWQFTPDGLMSQRYASINDEPIDASERRLGETGA